MTMASIKDRIVVLIDMDCFFCQVETKLQPEYRGKPLAVVQYNQWQLGGIIAVNYEAREYGVTRHMRGEEAKEKCPDLILASVPCLRGKADTSRYRNAGREVINTLKKHCIVIERASIDEAYLDITDIVNKKMSSLSLSPKELVSHLSTTYVVGYSEVGKNDEEARRKGTKIWINNIFNELQDDEAQKLAVAGTVVEELRSDIFKSTGFHCSAGISQNKILAKLACGLHKPNQQTILPAVAVPSLYSKLPIKKIRNLGGKFGSIVIDSLGCNVMGDLSQYSLEYLQKRFDDKTGLWLYNIARGIDNEPVVMRLVCKSIGACKKFPGPQAITDLEVLKHWADQLAIEVCERLEEDLQENDRRATLLTVCYHYYQNRKTVAQSRSCILNSYSSKKMANQCIHIITKATQYPIAYIGLSAGKFIEVKGSGAFVNFFKTNDSKSKDCSEINKNQTKNTIEETAVEVKAETKRNATQYLKPIESEESKTKQHAAAIEESNSIKDVHSISAETKDADENLPSSIEINESPMSRKVNRLVTICNAHNKDYDKPGSSSNRSINDNHFKESFFMNVFKDKKKECIEDVDRDKEKTDESKKYVVDGNIIVDIEKKSSNVQKDEESTDYSKINVSAEINVNDRVINKDECIVPMIESSVKMNTVDDNNYISNRYLSRNLEEEEENINYQNANKVSSTATNVSTAIEEPSIKLQDIFPDLQNIDASIVPLLPQNLQEEAKLYMKVQNKSNSKVTVHLPKNTKSNSCKNKTTSPKKMKNKLISSFLIKGTSDQFKEECLKHCMQCNQMIHITKYEEHMDFHVAQNLHEDINKQVGDTTTKRKVETTNIVNPAKRKSSEEILKARKDY